MKKTILTLLAIPFLLMAFGDSAQAKTVNGESKKVKMILDLDTGVDDAMALAYALGHPNIDLIGVTTVFGNVSRNTSINNTLALLDMFGRSDVPVYAGSDRARGANEAYVANTIVENIHGKNGVGNVDIPQSKRKVAKGDAVDFMIASAEKYGKDLYIVATGPQTNMGDLVKKAPKIGEKVGNIVIMGGALIVKGNMDELAEANIFNDPVAANELFTSGTPLTMVGLDVTLRPTLTKADTQKWRELGTKSGKAFADIVDFYIDFYLTTNLPGCALHDPLAVAVAMHPEYVTTLSLPMKVGVDKQNWGRTVADTHRMNDPKESNVKVAVDMQVDKFVTDFNGILTSLFSKF